MATPSRCRRAILLALALLGLLCLHLRAADLTVSLPSAGGRTSLADIGLYELHYQSYGHDPVAMPTSWTGHFDEQTGISYISQRILGREALLIHSPWRVPVGRTWVSYHLALPQKQPIHLQFGIAMAPDAVLPGKGDGATFTCQVTADGQTRKLLGEHYAQGAWKDFDFDLSAYAGKTINLELQVEPGPMNNAAFDYSYFGDPEIIIGDAIDQASQQLAAYTAKRAYQATRSADLRKLGNNTARPVVGAGAGGILPGNLLTYRNTIAPTQGGYVLGYDGEDCHLAYRYIPKAGTLDDFTVQLNDGRPFAIAAFGGLTAPDARRTLLRGQVKRIEKLGATLKVICQYDAAEVVWTFGIVGKALTIHATSQSPAFGGLDLGSAAVDFRRPITIPYLQGQAYYLPSQQAFACRYLDWTQSHASSCPQGVAHYDTRTDGTRNPLNEFGYIAISPELGEVLPSIPHPPSPYLSTLADRVILDVWGHHDGTYAGDAENLRTLKEWGVDHLLAIVHQWQRYGYDAKLPDHLPADSKYGGEEGMKELGRAAGESGYLFALHENYIDLYPDAPSYDPAARVLRADGTPSPAWYNEWTKVQSFGIKAGRDLAYAKANSPEIHRRYGTTAAYLDVNSSAPPWHQLDHDAAEPTAAMARGRIQGNIRLFQYERDTHGGPFLGEGANQFYWAGGCDGVEGQVEGGEDHTPLLDFDLLKLHPQMVNHGMGYYERWFRPGYQTRWGVDAANLEQIDKYRAQEIAYGHAGFIGANSTANPWWVAREHHLMYPIQRLYGDAKATAIEYEVNGQLVSIGAALIAGDTRRQHITYDSGLQVWVNWRPETWTIKAAGRSYHLPQWGFLALGPDTQVMTCLNAGRYADYAQCPEFLFADARTWTNMPYDRSATADIEPRLRSFEHLGEDRVRLSYEWIVREKIRPDLKCFVHAVNEQQQGPEHTVFQQDHPLPRPTTAWQPGETIIDGPYEVRIPASYATYDLRIGLYNEQLRLQMAGNDDKTGRYTIATLHLQQANGKITSITAERPKSIAQLPHRIDFAARMNPPGTWADFGLLATDGAVKAERAGAGGHLTLIPYPPTQAVKVILDLPAAAGASPDAKVEVRALAPHTHADLGPVPAQYQQGRLHLTLSHPNASRYVVSWR